MQIHWLFNCLDSLAFVNKSNQTQIRTMENLFRVTFDGNFSIHFKLDFVNLSHALVRMIIGYFKLSKITFW